MSLDTRREGVMRVGDVLEWLAGACAVAAVVAFGWHPVPLALNVAAAFCAYQAQCLADTEFKLPRLRIRRRAKKTAKGQD